METFSALLALCVANSAVIVEFPSQRPVTRSFDVFFDVRLNKRLSKQSWGWWVETPSCSLCRHCNVSIRQTVGFVPVKSRFIYVCVCFIHISSYWFVSVCSTFLVRSPCYKLRTFHEYLLTSRMCANLHKNAVSTSRISYEFSKNSNRYTNNKYDCFKEQKTFVLTLRITKNITINVWMSKNVSMNKQEWTRMSKMLRAYCIRVTFVIVWTGHYDCA